MIKIQPEIVFKIYNFPVTNTYLASLISVLIIILISLYINRNLKEKPSKIQSLVELIYESIFNFWHSITGLKNLKIFTFTSAFFIYILFSNLLGILPGFGSIYIKHGEEKIHILRTTYSDLNMTLALSILSVLFVNILGLYYFGVNYLKRFKGFVGLLELFAEFAKILSFSFRLFGNIFAGETLLIIIGLLLPFLAPIPFLGLEIFVGFIQSLIFFTLTSVFLKVVLTEH